MTCIAAVKTDNGIMMGCDSQVTTYTNMSMPLEGSKIVRIGEALVGFSGTHAFLQRLQYEFKFPEHAKKMSTHRYMSTVLSTAIDKFFRESCPHIPEKIRTDEGCTLCVGYRGDLFKVDHRGFVNEYDLPYLAFGSGLYIAMGSLHSTEGLLPPRQRIIRALRAAADLNTGVAPPFHIYTLKNKRPEAKK